jgi:hypothetical protein
MFKIDIMQFQLLIKDTLNEDYFSHCIKLWSGINRWWSANKTIPNRITTTDIYKAMIYNLKILTKNMANHEHSKIHKADSLVSGRKT